MFFAFELESVEKCLSNIQCEHTYASKLPNLLDMIFMKYMWSKGYKMAWLMLIVPWIHR